MEFSQQIAQFVLFLFPYVFFLLKLQDNYKVIHQPLSRPKQMRAGQYAVGRKIGLERAKIFGI
jgi:hypothetical protein